MRKLYFVRHGESDANVQRVISNRESAFHLTPRGQTQASMLAENLRDIPVTAIYSSPVLRARETADVLSKSFHLHYQVTEALREYDCGILEEKFDEESWKLHSEIAEDWILNHNYLREPEGGESFLDIQNRFLPFIESLKDGNNEHILLIGHGGLFHLMLPLILTNIDHQFVTTHGLGHTEYVVAEYLSDHFVCRSWGDRTF
jgi:broad specificity phosphatase PhoE